jgi:pimeloyl-ACP methyl ester carboxylesterase
MREGHVTNRAVSESYLELRNGTRVFYHRLGEGEPVVLLHGIAHSSQAWQPVLPALAERYEVVAIDMPGCGRSDKPDTDYSLGAQATAVRYILDALKLDFVTVVGHSLGGGIAMTLAYQYPERVGRLGLVSSAGLGRDLHPLFRIATLPIAPERVMRVLFNPMMRYPRNAVGAAFSGLTGDAFFHQPKKHRREFEELLLGLEDPAAQRAFLATLRSASNYAGQAVSALDRLALARFPLLMVWGRYDKVFPVDHMRRARKEVPHAQAVVIDNCGHFPQLEATRVFTRVLLRWLDETEPMSIYPIASRQPAQRQISPRASA